MSKSQLDIGEHVKEWRKRRRVTQLEVALAAGVSTRHLSFIETGRAVPSRQMVLHLAEYFRVPIRERNMMLVSAGYAPMFMERSLEDPALAAVQHAISLILERHKPYPAFALDRHWNVVASNRALPVLYEGIAPHLLQPPINVMRLSLHPEGMSTRIENLPEWRAHALHRVQEHLDLSADPVLLGLHRELLSYPAPPQETTRAYDVFVPYRVQTRIGLLSFLTTTMVFGTPLDVTLSELMLECFFPADGATADTVQALSAH